jgi:hypothetical protein
VTVIITGAERLPLASTALTVIVSDPAIVSRSRNVARTALTWRSEPTIVSLVVPEPVIPLPVADSSPRKSSSVAVKIPSSGPLEPVAVADGTSAAASVSAKPPPLITPFSEMLIPLTGVGTFSATRATPGAATAGGDGGTKKSEGFSPAEFAPLTASLLVPAAVPSVTQRFMRPLTSKPSNSAAANDGEVRIQHGSIVVEKPAGIRRGNDELACPCRRPVGDPNIDVTIGVEAREQRSAAQDRKIRVQLCGAIVQNAARVGPGNRQLAGARRGPISHPEIKIAARVLALEQGLAGEDGKIRIERVLVIIIEKPVGITPCGQEFFRPEGVKDPDQRPDERPNIYLATGRRKGV